MCKSSNDFWHRVLDITNTIIINEGLFWQAALNCIPLMDHDCVKNRRDFIYPKTVMCRDQVIAEITHDLINAEMPRPVCFSLIEGMHRCRLPPLWTLLHPRNENPTNPLESQRICTSRKIGAESESSPKESRMRALRKSDRKGSRTPPPVQIYLAFPILHIQSWLL